MSIPDIDVFFPPAPLPHVIVPFPLYITVHLGAPDEEALNVTVPFLDYIKNVASSELYPTWPEEALRANIYAISSIAMNRIFSEWYRGRGYDFDITNAPQYDQSYVHERGIFDSISEISNEIFDEYIVREGRIEPLFATFCDGRISQCNGMYQWGSVDLANQGYSALDILKYYYGDDILIAKSAGAAEITGTYPGEPLVLGDSGISVLRMQHSLSRISNNFPLIPEVEITGYFDESTENAVKIFQEIFGLPVTGIVDIDTWYRIRFLYIAVTHIAQIISEGLSFEELQQLFANVLLEGGELPIIAYVEFFLDIVSQRYPSIKPVDVNMYYGPRTTAAVREFQRIMGLNQTGIVNQETMNYLYWTAYSILMSTPVEELRIPMLPYAGIDLIEGMGPEFFKIVILEIILNFLAARLPEMPAVEVGGIFGPDTRAAVVSFQNLYGLPVTGVVDEETWNKLFEVYNGFLAEIPENQGI